MVGSEIIRQCIADPEIAGVTAIVRRTLAMKNPKLTVIAHNDFMDYSGIQDVFKNHDACLWCLGISQTQVKSKEEYHQITYGYTLAAAKAILSVNPKMRFYFVSGMGADPTMKSKTLFARVKGETENALKQLNLEHLTIFRPAGIQPVHGKDNAPFYEKLLYPLMPLLVKTLPQYFITSVDLAKAMLYVVKHGSSKTLLEHRDFQEIAKIIHHAEQSSGSASV